jgi:hypothetical protein
MTVRLPVKPRRALLRSFCLAGSSTALMVLLLLLGFSHQFVMAGAAVVLLAVIGIISPTTMIIPYRGWNKCAEYYARVARHYFSVLCFHLIVRLVGRTALTAQFIWPNHSASFWVPRSTLGSDCYSSQHEGPDTASACASWIITFLLWARGTSNLWAICLLPFLVLLGSVTPEEEKGSRSSDIYTLF